MTSYNFSTYDLHTWNAWNNDKQRETVFFFHFFFEFRRNEECAKLN